MKIFVNGQETEIREDTLSALLRQLSQEQVALKDPRGIALAVNDFIVPKGSWSDTKLTSGDRISLFTASQGG